MIPPMATSSDQLKVFTKSPFRKTFCQFLQNRNAVVIRCQFLLIAHAWTRELHCFASLTLAKFHLLQLFDEIALLVLGPRFKPITSLNTWFSSNRSATIMLSLRFSSSRSLGVWCQPLPCRHTSISIGSRWRRKCCVRCKRLWPTCLSRRLLIFRWFVFL